jgi:hypothetical protein
MVVLGGCAADAEEPAPPVRTFPPAGDVTLIDGDEEMDVCALAAQLPTEDICSLVCDPVAMAAFMVAAGEDGGTCYQLYCSLPGDAHVLVGVCLPP